MRKLVQFGLQISLVIGLVLRLISLNQSLWLDEATSALAARMSLINLFTKFLPNDFHPPLYYLILKYWTQVFGSSEISLRIPSVIFGVATIYIIFLIGKKLYNEKIGIIAAVLLATSGLHVYYSQEARMYSLAALLVSALIYSFLQESWILFSIILPLIGMADYVSLIIIPVIWTFSIIEKKNKDWWKKFSLTHIPFLLVFSLWAPTFLKQLRNGLAVSSNAPGWWNILGQVTLKNIGLIPVKFIFGRISIDNKLVYDLAVIIVGGIFAYLLFKAKKFSFSWLWLIESILLGIGLSIFIPTLTYFRFLFALPAFYLLLSVGIFNIKRSLFKIALVFVLLVNLISSLAYLTSPRFWREDWRNMVKFAESRKTTNSITIFVADSNMEAYRYYAPDAKIAGPEAIKNGYDQIWLMRYVQDVFDPGDTVRVKIEKLGYKKSGEYDFNGVVVWEYSKNISYANLN